MELKCLVFETYDLYAMKVQRNAQVLRSTKCRRRAGATASQARALAPWGYRLSPFDLSW
jgi:hypothetical protein